MGLEQRMRTVAAGLLLSATPLAAQYSPEAANYASASDIVSPAPDIKFSNKYTASPNKRTPFRKQTKYIVVHWTEDDFAPKYLQRNRLTNYLISRPGIIYRVVNKDRASGHVYDNVNMWDGITNLNDFSVGIEVVSTGTNGFTENQYVSLKHLVSELQQIYKIPDENVLSHADVSFPRGRKVDLACMPEWRSRIDLRERFDSTGLRVDRDADAGRAERSPMLALMEEKRLCTIPEVENYLAARLDSVRAQVDSIPLPPLRMLPTADPESSAQAFLWAKYLSRAPLAPRF